jgi:hypothetical protein
MVVDDRTRHELEGLTRDLVGTPIDEVLFRSGYASHVFGLRLIDGREVVAKLRDYTPRLIGAAVVQQHEKLVPGFRKTIQQ